MIGKLFKWWKSTINTALYNKDICETLDDIEVTICMPAKLYHEDMEFPFEDLSPTEYRSLKFLCERWIPYLKKKHNCP